MQGNLEKHVYMVPPPIFQFELNNLAVFRLKKSPYELKQALRAWKVKITQRLHRMGFQPSQSDSSLFIQQGHKGLVSILLYVEDLVIADVDLEEIGQVKSQLVATFEMKDLGDLHYFLGIEVIQTLEGILISQRHYMINIDVEAKI